MAYFGQLPCAEKKMSKLKVLQDKIAKLEAQAEALAKKETEAILTKIRELMEKNGVTLDDIKAHAHRKTTRGRATSITKSTAPSRVVKYLNPETGATWSGRGRRPMWLADAKDLNKFLVEEELASTNTSEKSLEPGKHPRKSRKPSKASEVGSAWNTHATVPLQSRKGATEAKQPAAQCNDVLQFATCSSEALTTADEGRGSCAALGLVAEQGVSSGLAMAAQLYGGEVQKQSGHL
jgi:DNA-binding protein H-NS